MVAWSGNSERCMNEDLYECFIKAWLVRIVTAWQVFGIA